MSCGSSEPSGTFLLAPSLLPPSLSPQGAPSLSQLLPNSLKPSPPSTSSSRPEGLSQDVPFVSTSLPVFLAVSEQDLGLLLVSLFIF